MRLRDLLASYELPLELLTGEGDLDRTVRWVYTTDLPDPGRYLVGEELILTGLMWRRGPADSERFVAALAGAGVSALGAGDARYGSVPSDLVDACRRRGLPLIEVPADVSFGTVTEVVLRRLSAERAGGPATVLGRHRRLISAVAEGDGLRAVFAATRDDLGLGCWLLSPTGRVVAGDGGALTVETARTLATEFLRAERLPHVTRGGFTLLPVGSRTGSRLASWFLACDRRLFDVGAEVRESAYELAVLAALERARLEEGRRVERRLAAELVETAPEAAEGEVAARMRTCGLDPERPYVAVSSAVSGVPQSAAVGGAVLDELLADGTGQGGHRAVASFDEEAVALVATGEARRVAEHLRAEAGRLSPALPPARLTVGVSAAASGHRSLAGAVGEARRARALAALRPGHLEVVSSEEAQSYARLLASVPEEVRRSFGERLLRPLCDYDAEHRSDLVRTLGAFLECSGGWNRCAATLHVHVNTLRYRVRRIEQLTGRDLSSLEDRVDFFLALRADAAGSGARRSAPPPR